MINRNYYTRKELCRITGAKPYQIAYLLSIGKLQLANELTKRGKPNKYLVHNLEVIHKHLEKNYELFGPSLHMHGMYCNDFIEQISKKIKWIKSLDDISEIPFILIANEFFDALPIKQIQLTKIGWRERMVNYDKKKRNFFISYSNNPTVLENFLPKNKECSKIGSIYEIPFNMISFLENLFKKIKKTKSTCLIIDYAKNENFGNSLKSIKKQKIINPLKEIGNSDISVHVNFNLIKKTSTKFNLNSHGPISQRKFLIELGILYRAEILIKNANNKQKKKLKKSLDFLINKKKMGEIFNVISISNKKIKYKINYHIINLCIYGI